LSGSLKTRFIPIWSYVLKYQQKIKLHKDLNLKYNILCNNIKNIYIDIIINMFFLALELIYLEHPLDPL